MNWTGILKSLLAAAIGGAATTAASYLTQTTRFNGKQLGTAAATGATLAVAALLVQSPLQAAAEQTGKAASKS